MCNAIKCDMCFMIHNETPTVNEHGVILCDSCILTTDNVIKCDSCKCAMNSDLDNSQVSGSELCHMCETDVCDDWTDEDEDTYFGRDGQYERDIERRYS